MWRSLVVNCVDPPGFRISSVCRLSHSISVLYSRVRLIDSKNLSHQIVSLAASDIARSFASVELVVTVFPQAAFQCIIPLKSLKAYIHKSSVMSWSCLRRLSLMMPKISFLSL